MTVSFAYLLEIITMHTKMYHNKLAKVYLAILCLALLPYNNTLAQTKQKALFLGNSYTGANSLPQLVANAALSAGDTLIYDSNTPGGMRLRYHTWDTVSQQKLRANDWDYVILQGQSQESITGNHSFTSGGQGLTSQIRALLPCASPLLYMTWGRKNGDASNCASYPIMCTYEGMDTTIRDRYLSLAALLKVEVSPVSVVWKYLRNNHPQIELYQADGSHPSPAGSYAAACCFYTTIFQKDPTLIAYNHNLSPSDAAAIRMATKLAVFDNLHLWNYTQAPKADFSFKADTTPNTIAFFAHDSVDTYLWNFGDGNTSSAPNPVHTYAANGTYTVQLTATECHQQSSTSTTSDTVIQFCTHTPSISPPRPWLCILDTLWTEPADAYQWLYNGSPIAEYGQSLVDYRRYGYGPFSVLATTNGCTELSEEYWENPVFDGFYFYDSPQWANPCMGDTLYFIALHYSNPITGNEFIQWFKDSVLIAQGTDSLIVTSGGFYEMKAINPNASCPQDTSYTYLNINCGPLGLAPNQPTLLDWKLYPNPATHTIWLEGDLRFVEQVFIYNALGVLVKRVVVDSSMPSIDVADLPQGVYFLTAGSRRYKVLRFVRQ